MEEAVSVDRTPPCVLMQTVSHRDKIHRLGGEGRLLIQRWQVEHDLPCYGIVGRHVTPYLDRRIEDVAVQRILQHYQSPGLRER